jgi:hypothetical protein
VKSHGKAAISFLKKAKTEIPAIPETEKDPDHTKRTQRGVKLRFGPF